MTYLEQCSNFNMHRYHQEGLLKHRLLSPCLDYNSESLSGTSSIKFPGDAVARLSIHSCPSETQPQRYSCSPYLLSHL